MYMELHDPNQIAQYEEAGVWEDETLLDRFADTVA